MSRNSILPLALLAALLLGTAACGPEPDREPPKPKVVNAADLPALGAAPAWKLKDVNGTVVSSDQFKGKILVIDFWATWCAPCKAEIPGYIALTKKYGKDGLVIVGVSADQAGPEVVKDFVARSTWRDTRPWPYRLFSSGNRMNYPVVMFDDDVLTAFGGIEILPTTFLIDRTGQIRDRKVGAEPAADYEAKIVALLK